MSTNQVLFNKYLRVIVGVGLMLRLITVWLTRNVPTPKFSDSHEYIRLGNQVAAGRWLTFADGTADFSRPPGYPIFLGGIIKIQDVLGLDGFSLRLTAGFVQAVLAALSIWIFAHLIKRRVPVYGARLGLVTALLLSISLDMVGWSAPLMTEALSLPLLVIGCGILLWEKQPSAAFLMGAGAIFSISILVRSANAPVAAVAMLVVIVGANWKSYLKWLGLFVLGAIAILAPWFTYSHHHTGRILLIDTTRGENSCLASSDYANGHWNPNCKPRLGVDAYQEMDRQEAEARRWFWSHRREWAVLRLKNTVMMALQDSGSWRNVFYPHTSPGVIDAINMFWWFAMVITGCLAFWRGGKVAGNRIFLFQQLALIGLAVTVAPIMFFQEQRFSVGLLPFVYLCSAYWLCTTQYWPGKQVQRALARLGIAEDSFD